MRSLIADILNRFRYPVELKVILWAYQGELTKEEVVQTDGKALPSELRDLVLIQAKDCLPSDIYTKKRTCYCNYTIRCRVKDGVLHKSPLCKVHLKFEDGDYDNVDL